MTYRIATKEDFEGVLKLALALWPDEEDVASDIQTALTESGHAIYIAEDNGRAIGFIEMALRTDYVEGSNSSPVAYIEGLFVAVTHRKQGIAHELVRCGEEWGKENRCTEMGSDVLVDNTISQEFHENIGFRKAETIVCYIKEIS